MAVSIKHNKRLASRAAARQARQVRGRKHIHGTADRPRLVVTRSAKHIRVQVVDDDRGHTIVSASTLDADLRASDADKTAKSRQVGELIAQRAKDAGIDAVVFDRAGNRYAGRIAALAEGAREGGLEF